MKEVLNKISAALSWIFLGLAVLLLVFTAYQTVQAKQTGEDVFIFGHRPILVLTGSMEPYMMVNGICLTQEVDSIDDIEVGDVVTYHVNTTEGRMIRITHRIIDMDENGMIYTKGDNNKVADAYPLTMDNIDSKVIGVFNQTAWIYDKWQTTVGKVMIISFGLALVLLYVSIKLIFNKDDDEEEDIKQSSDESIIDITAEEPVSEPSVDMDNPSDELK